ncbi:dephospho-CoA kinase [Anseongella ginsenosidimutans]|uniref:Dephospho-CoA kinase n=1 Tax=Anseongella ginsenosidimutans TaxID=496056 RepID=A0A4R3KS61_9SPHI|nr:dephospho-CoA kinase [Anseongella ginsenosidimutans]QEC53182.1 dephospho-CoA kinase [Anseongella ginsenosidimutans]TCS87810.1 dephospho-CoA kinase [Anseongella ginsenosidimutans]
MIKVGLTGGIGSGKTTVSRIFSVLGIPVFSADTEGKRLMAEDAGLAAAIMDIFGKDTYLHSEGGGLQPDRRKLAGIVFNNEEKLNQLNALVHPAVINAFETWAGQQNSAYVIKESALLFESDAWKHSNLNITVAAPEEERIRRVMKRDGVERSAVMNRMKHQLSDEERIQRADLVIWNDNRSPVIPQVLAIHRLLLYSPTDLIL